jgi:hypothetical protein
MATAKDVLWFKENFAAQILPKLTGTPFDLDMIVAIACQETGEIWSILRKKGLSKTEVAALCNGDSLDGSSRTPRRAFPVSKAALEAEPRGDEMFAIARQALIDMAQYVPGYEGAVKNKSKICHGFGVFQRDLQFFLDDPDYFLDQRYADFDLSLDHCLKELRRGLKVMKFEGRTSLSDYDFACVAIVYNTGKFIKERGLKQGHKSGGLFYGEWIERYVGISRTVSYAAAAAALSSERYIVNSRTGLNLRKGPGTEFGIVNILPLGTEVNVLGIDGPNRDWARVDLEGDGHVDGHMSLPFLTRAP